MFKNDPSQDSHEFLACLDQNPLFQESENFCLEAGNEALVKSAEGTQSGTKNRGLQAIGFLLVRDYGSAVLGRWEILLTQSRNTRIRSPKPPTGVRWLNFDRE